jgi:hypothetical protein
MVSLANAIEGIKARNDSIHFRSAKISLSPPPARRLAGTLAAAELVSPRHNENARRAFVLLTDGLPTAGGTVVAIEAALAAAESMRLSGADVYVIGLGQNVDAEFIRSIASTPDNAYLAPSRADLATMYAAITASLCEVGPTKIEVLAKPPVTFAPLR